MKRGTLLFGIFVVAAVAIGLFASACSNQPTSDATSSPAAGVVKPRPVVQSVNATTSGMEENYYAILNVTVKNEGAAGTVMVVGTITQGTQTTENSFPVNIRQNSTEVVPLVFKLKWQGEDWKPVVEVRIP